jgi:hypothetical protein
METKDNVINFRGNCQIITNFDLEKLAKLVSKVLCGDLNFTFGKHSIWEEIPSMYIENSLLGMLIVLGGYGGEQGFTLEISQYGEFSRYVYSSHIRDSEVRVNLNTHLYHLLKEGLKEYEQITIVKP